ncbi:hypothetical protein H2203_002236 [Taxawa tesnikishii (nom. ined.)]|nr:hypothetical protein H2203_002236 [Dothideales sp. JES 119]
MPSSSTRTTPIEECLWRNFVHCYTYIDSASNEEGLWGLLHLFATLIDADTTELRDCYLKQYHRDRALQHHYSVCAAEPASHLMNAAASVLNGVAGILMKVGREQEAVECLQLAKWLVE